MHDQPIQRAVLVLVLDAHPKSLAVSGLARELGTQDVESAVSALVSIGLLEREDETVSPSAAALHFYRLDLP